MKNHLLGLLVLLFTFPCVTSDAGETSEETSEYVVQDRLQSIISTYEEDLRAYAQARAPISKLQQLKETRDAQLQDLIENHKEVPLTKMSAPDLVAMSISMEYLRQWEESVHYARQAYVQAPGFEPVYATLIRTLLNLRRVDEAEGYLTRGIEKLGPRSPICALHFFMARSRQREGKLDKSIEHFEALYSFYMRRLSDESFDLAIPAMHLSPFWDVLSQAKECDKGKKLFSQYLEQITAIHAFRVPDANATEKRLHRSTLLFGLRHELVRIAIPDQLKGIQEEWLIFATTQLTLQPDSQVALGAFGRMVSVIRQAPAIAVAKTDEAVKILRASSFSQEHTNLFERIKHDLNQLTAPASTPGAQR